MNNDITIFYGIENNNVDVTYTALTKCVKNNILRIPNNDHIRLSIFKIDPTPNVVKSIFIYDKEHKLIGEYDHTENIKINLETNEIFRGAKELHSCILIIACYPNNLCYLHHLNNLIDRFKKIYFIYSEHDEINNFENQIIFQNNKIKLIKVENIGCDFKKYYIGISEIKKNNESFNYLFIINDSFMIDDWNKTIFNDNIFLKIYNNDIVGMFESLCFKNHLQSFFLIMNNKITDLYYNYLSTYNFKKNISEEDKNNIIMDLEVNFNNSIISNPINKYSKVFDILNNKQASDLYFNINNIYNSLIKDNYFNPELVIGPFYNIYKIGYLNSVNFDIIFKNTDIFKERLNIYFHCYKPFVRYYNYFYNGIKYNTPLKKNYTPINKYIDIYSIITYYNINITKYNFYKDNNSKNIYTYLSEKFGCEIEDIQIAISLINFIKKYNGYNNFIAYLKSTYFYKKSNKVTEINDLIYNIQQIQSKTKNKKLIYTNNINSYDTFWDIDDDIIEKDTDYIYISNVIDNNVCKNFNFIYCNLDSNDEFYINRLIKFNKTLFNCYDKVLYIDSNIRIITKLTNFFNSLDVNNDILIFSHPERNTINEEINTLELCSCNHNKWNLKLDNLNILKKNYKNELSNNLYWLSIQLSNTKYNIFEDIKEIYEKFKLKRDQIYFGLIENKYKKQIIYIKFKNSNFKNDIKLLDGHYGYIEWWSDKFTRPFGGLHY